MVYDSLAQLRVGEGWIWAPDHDLLKRVKFPAITTLDTSKTPRAGDSPITAPVLAAADIARLKSKFAKIEGLPNGNAELKRSQIKTKRATPPDVLQVRTTRTKKPPATTRDPVAAAIVRVRTKSGLTQAELAQRLKTHQGNIARLERGRTPATVRTLKRIASATGYRLVIDFRK
jgi:ribosome-binding protein aMBF1 (putative translation factor)